MDSDIRKQVMRLFTYGVYVLTARQKDEVVGSTVTWVSQASFEPLRITVAVKVGGRAHEMLETGSKFALNLIGQNQREIAAAFFKPPKWSDGQLSGYPCHDGALSGAPILDDAPGWLEAQINGSIEGGDHTIFVADVLDLGLNGDALDSLALRDTPWHYGH